MDDSRKRAAPIIDRDESAPPPKRHNTMPNGLSSEDKADMPRFGTVNAPWQVDLDTLQKDALYRQMREYKREKQQLEAQVVELEKKSIFHDNHLRVIDQWWIQLIDEVKVLVNVVPSSASPPNSAITASAALFDDSEKFQEHLSARSENIKALLSLLYSKLPTLPPDNVTLQKRVNELLASEKEHVLALQQAQDAHDQMQDRLDHASYRYLMAERKLDRSKSQAVASLEMQGQMQSQALKSEPSEGNTNGHVHHGSTETNGVASEEAERDRLEAIAVATKVKEQLKQLETDNSKLTTEVTQLKAKSACPSDEDYAGTELFKLVKMQLEDSYNKLNDLEATHIKLREEAKQAQAERTSYRLHIVKESQDEVSSNDAMLARADADLQRVRAARDDLAARNAILEASYSERHLSMEQLQALTKARDDRVKALENEVQRLQIKCSEINVGVTEEELAITDVEELQAKLSSVSKEYSLLSNELPSMEQAWRKAQALASGKVAQFTQWEEQMGRLNAEKAKADQKYFGAMKMKEAQEGELRTLRKQNKASSGIITSLKETEAKSRELCTNLEKQLAEDKYTIDTLARSQQMLNAKVEQAQVVDKAYSQTVEQLKSTLGEKDSILSISEHSRREVEQEVEALKVQLEVAAKKTEEWRVKANSSSSSEVTNLRRVAYCQCGKNLKDTCITLCGHILCKSCVDDRVKNRMRKCPICMIAFGAKDTKTVHLV